MSFSNVKYLDCMGSGFLEPFDPRCRYWYQEAIKNPGN